MIMLIAPDHFFDKQIFLPFFPYKLLRNLIGSTSNRTGGGPVPSSTVRNVLLNRR